MAVEAARRKRVAAVLFLGFAVDELETKIPKKINRNVYMREWISRREEKGIYHQLIKELLLEDEIAYRDFFRVNKRQFLYLVQKVSPLITRQEQPNPLNLFRSSIKPDERLAVTLRFLATGESYHSLEYSFRISRQAISSIVRETCEAIYQTMAPEYFKTPNNEEEWKKISEKFDSRWNFPNGIGAIDGKRINIQQPNNAGSHYYDYKGNNSVILLAAFGPDYQCIWASVGTNGR